MATFVLVHGAWAGGWCWSEIVPALCRAGHSVYAPSLTGLGERSHLVGVGQKVGLDLHVEDVVAVLEWNELDDVILCGHSYGGMVITGAAARVPERIRTLFYLDAFVPEDGQSLADLRPPTERARMEAGAAQNGGLVPPLVHPPRDPPTAVAEAYARRRRPLALECFTQPVRLTGREAAIANRTFVYATVGAPTSFTRFYDVLQDDPAWRVHTVDTGHLVMVDDPATLTRLLLDEVGR